MDIFDGVGGFTYTTNLDYEDPSSEVWMDTCLLYTSAVELLEGEQLRGTRLYTVPPHHEDGPADVRIEGIRLYLPGGAGPEGLTLRADAHYIDRGDRCVLP